MSFKRILPILVLAFVAAASVVSLASAGGIRDWDPCPDNGTDLQCPDGMVGIPYSIKFRAVEEPPCQPGEESWHIVLDAAPTGLSLESDTGILKGTPTEPGTWGFWVEMRLPTNDHCNGAVDTTQERFVLTIKPTDPALLPKPKLTIGPELTTPGTVGTPYSLPMTANLPEAKQWSIAAGELPAGLTLGATDGIITGTPTRSGTFTFTVLSVLAEDPARSDTKTLTIDIRDRLTITAPDEFDVRRFARTEVGESFLTSFEAFGGFGDYTWSSLNLPTDFELDADGTLSGEPTEAGTYPFTVTVTDEEGRRASYPARIVVAERLAILTKRVAKGRVGVRYRAKITHEGGVAPVTRRIKRGPLPRGVFFNPSTGAFFGTPVKAGTWRVAIEIVDALGVKAKVTVKIVVAAAPKR